MLYAKALAVGVVAGVLAPIVAGAAAFLWLFFAGFGSYDIHVHDVAVQNFFLTVSPEQLLAQMSVGFVIGFLFTLWAALVKTNQTR